MKNMPYPKNIFETPIEVFERLLFYVENIQAKHLFNIFCYYNCFISRLLTENLRKECYNILLTECLSNVDTTVTKMSHFTMIKIVENIIQKQKTVLFLKP